MGFKTGSGAVIKVGVEGAGESRRQIEGIGDSFNKLPGVVRGAMGAVAASMAAALSVTAFTGWIKGSLDAAAGINDLSIETGASAASLMKFKEIGLTSDTTIQSIAGSMNKLAKNMAVANEESAGTGQAIQALGLNFDELKKMSPEQKLLTIAKALDGFKDGAGKSAVAMTLMGKEGAKQLPFLTDLANEADSVAASFTEQEKAAKAAYTSMADNFGDNITKIQHASDEWKRDLAAGMVPALFEATEAFITATGGAGGFKAEIKRLSDDGSIAEWTRVAITGVTYLMDAFQGAGRIVKAVGMYIGASLAVSVTSITGIANAMALFVRGEFTQSWAAIKSTATATVEIGKDFMSDLSDTFGAQSFGSKIRDRMEEVKGLGAAAKKVKGDLNFSAKDDSKDKAAAIAKEVQAYASLISSIRAKTEENKLELLVGENALPSQKERIKLDQELASGKVKLSAAHKLEAYAALDAQEASDKLVRAMQTERDVTKYVAASALARKDSSAQLQVEYAMYGKSADAREIAMVAIKEETALEKFLLDEKSAGKTITQDQITQLKAEAAARSGVEQAALGQAKALGYAGQLAAENKRFAAESILDEEGRAAALLRIDAQMWEDRIALAGQGTEAQKKLQGEYDTWYQNQMLKPQLESQKKIWDSIEQTAHDTWISVADGAKGAAQRARDTLKNILFDWLYQMTVKKWIFNVGASFTGSAASGVAQAAGAAGNGGSVLGAVGSIGSMISSAGTLLGSSAVSAFGSGFTAAVATGSGEAAMLASAATAGNLSAGAAAGASAGGVASGIASSASAALAAIPVWGWAALAGAAAIAYFSNSGPEDHTRLNFTSNNAAGNISINERGNEGKTGQEYIDGSGKSAFGTFGVASTFWMNAAQPVVQDFIKTVTQTDDALASFLSATEKASVSSYLTGKVSIANTGAEGTNPNANGELDKVFAERISNILEGVAPGLSSLVAGFNGTSQALATEAAGLLQYRAALKDSGEAVFGVKVTLQEIAALKNTGELTTAALSRVTNVFAATNQVAELFGKTGAEAFGIVGLASISAREKLIAASGSLETLTQQTASFAQNYFTEAERLVPVVKSVDAQMAALGLSSVKTVDEFKSTVLALDLTSSSGVATFAALMNVQAAFAQVHPAIDEATTAVSEAVVKVTDTAAIAKEQRGLDIELLKALGHGEQALAMERSDALDSLLSDGARATQIAINAANDTAAAIAKAKDSSATAFSSLGDAFAGIITGAQESASAIRALKDEMKAGDLSSLSVDAKYDLAKRKFETADGKDFEAAATEFLKVSKARDAGELAYATDFAAVLARSDQVANGEDARAIAIANQWRELTAPGGALAMNGSHANGLAYVPFDGYRAETHKGEAILTASDAKTWRAGDSGALVEEVKQMRVDMQAALEAIAVNTGGTTRLLNRAIVADVLQTAVAA